MATDGRELGEAMAIGLSDLSWFNVVSDDMNQRDICNYWLGIANFMNSRMVESPPGSGPAREDL